MPVNQPSGITILVDGTPTDLADVFWLHVAPCGCYSGVTTAYRPPWNVHPGKALTTVAQVAADWYEDEKWRRKHDEAAGFHFVPKTRAWYQEQTSTPERTRAFMSCTHDPEWGVPPRAAVEGHRWAATSSLRVLHLVAWPWTGEDGQPAETSPWRRSEGRIRALCGSEQWHWDSRWHATTAKPDCTRCTKAAAKRNATPAAPPPAADAVLV